MLLKLFRISDINELQCVFNSYSAPSDQIIHQELDKIKKIPGFEPCLVKYASLVHESKLILINGVIEILIDLPDPLIHLRFTVNKI